MKNVSKRVWLIVLIAFFVVCTLLFGTQIKSNVTDPTAVAADGTTVTIEADKTDVVPGDTVALTIKLKNTRTDQSWFNVAVRLGPVNTADMKTPLSTEIGQHLSATVPMFQDMSLYSRYNNQSSVDFVNTSTIRRGIYLSCSDLGSNPLKCDNELVFTTSLTIKETIDVSSFTLGVQVYNQNYTQVYLPPSGQKIKDMATTTLSANTVTFNLGVASDDATLSGLKVGHDTANQNAIPALADEMTYNTSSANRTLKVQPTANDAGATIKIGTGSAANATTAVASGATADVTLTGGTTDVYMVVTAADGTTTKTYKLTVNSGYARLQNVNVSTNSAIRPPKNGLGTVTFNPETATYTVFVPSDATTATFTPTIPTNYGIQTSIKAEATNCTAASTVNSGSGLTVSNIGNNASLKLTVTAADGTTKPYTFNFTKVSTDTELTSVKMIGKGQTTEYTSDDAKKATDEDFYFGLPYECNYTGTFVIEKNNSLATVTVDGNPYSTTAEFTNKLVNIVVTAEAGNSRTYKARVAKSVLSASFLSLGFSTTGSNNYADVFSAAEYNSANNTFTKTINVSEGVSNVFIGGTVTNGATVQVTGGLTANGSVTNNTHHYKAPVSLGKHTFTLTARSDAGSSSYTFVINVVEDKSGIIEAVMRNSADNSQITDFVFNPSTREYTVNVPYKTSAVNFTFKGEGNYTSVYVNGSKLTRNDANRTHEYTTSLTANATKTIVVYGMSNNGDSNIGQKGTEYTIKINRAAADDDATLKSLTVTIGGELQTINFEEGKTIYPIQDLREDTSNRQIDITAEPKKATSTVTGAGTFTMQQWQTEDPALGVKTQTFIVKVTAESGRTKEYKIVISQKEIVLSKDYGLGDLQIVTSKGDTIFSMAKDGLAPNTPRTIRVPFDVDSVFVEASATSGSATVNGTGQKTLLTGNNDVVVWVEAEDGSNSGGKLEKYEFHIIREEAADRACLDDLQINDSTINLFRPTLYNYSMTVAASVEEVSLRAVAELAKSKVTVSVAGSEKGSEIHEVYVGSIALGAQGSTVVIAVNVSIDDKSQTYTVSITRSTEKPYLTSLDVSGLTLHDRDGNAIDGSDANAVKNVEHFYVDVDGTISNLFVNATASDSAATLNLPGSNGSIRVADLFKNGTTAVEQIRIEPQVGDNAIYYIHFNLLNSNTDATIDIEEITEFNYIDNTTVYGVYPLDYSLSTLKFDVNVGTVDNTPTGTYKIFYNGVLKNNNGVDFPDVQLGYGINYVTVDLISNDGRNSKTVVVLVDRGEPGLISAEIAEIEQFKIDFDAEQQNVKNSKKEFENNPMDIINRPFTYYREQVKYSYSVASDIKNLNLKVTVDENFFRYEIENPEELVDGENIIKIYLYEKENAESGISTVSTRASGKLLKTYTVKVYRQSTAVTPAEDGGIPMIWQILCIALGVVCLILLLLLIIILLGLLRRRKEPASQIINVSNGPNEKNEVAARSAQRPQDRAQHNARAAVAPVPVRTEQHVEAKPVPAPAPAPQQTVAPQPCMVAPQPYMVAQPYMVSPCMMAQPYPYMQQQPYPQQPAPAPAPAPQPEAKPAPKKSKNGGPLNVEVKISGINSNGVVVNGANKK